MIRSKKKRHVELVSTYHLQVLYHARRMSFEIQKQVRDDDIRLTNES